MKITQLSNSIWLLAKVRVKFNKAGTVPVCIGCVDVTSSSRAFGPRRLKGVCRGKHFNFYRVEIR